MECAIQIYPANWKVVREIGEVQLALRRVDRDAEGDVRFLNPRFDYGAEVRAVQADAAESQECSRPIDTRCGLIDDNRQRTECWSARIYQRRIRSVKIRTMKRAAFQFAVVHFVVDVVDRKLGRLG